VVVISFNDKLLAEVRDIEPRVPTALLVGGEIEEDPQPYALRLLWRARECGASCIDMSKALAVPEVVSSLRCRGMAAWVWTVDDRETMQYLTSLGVDAITTNRPDVLRALYDELAL